MNTSPLASLSAGLLLEDRHILLPWGASGQILAETGRPDQVERTAWDRLSWSQPVILAGLQTACLEIDLPTGQPFDHAWAWLARGHDPAAAAAAFQAAFDHLCRRFGPPVPPVPDLIGWPYIDQIACWETHLARLGLVLKTGPEFAHYDVACRLIIQPAEARD